jgi:hypothetical protein
MQCQHHNITSDKWSDQNNERLYHVKKNVENFGFIVCYDIDNVHIEVISIQKLINIDCRKLVDKHGALCSWAPGQSSDALTILRYYFLGLFCSACIYSTCLCKTHMHQRLPHHDQTQRVWRTLNDNISTIFLLNVGTVPIYIYFFHFIIVLFLWVVV